MMSPMFYIRDMALEEKRAWIMATAVIGTYIVYVAVVLGRLRHTPAAEVPYVAILLWTVGISVAVTIVSHIAVSIAAPKADSRRDQRDREIGRLGEHTG